MSLSPAFIDEIDRRAAKLKADGFRPRETFKPSSDEKALRAFMHRMQAYLSRATGRVLHFEFDEETTCTFVISVDVRKRDAIRRQDIMTISCHPSRDHDAPRGAVEFCAHVMVETQQEIVTDIFVRVLPPEYPFIAEEYADAFLDVVAEGVASGWDVL